MSGRASALLALAGVLLAGCGSQSITDRVRSEYPAYATRQHFGARALTLGRVTCDHDATGRYDGWCRITPKGFHEDYDVPYRDGRPLWGDSGLMRAP